MNWRKLLTSVLIIVTIILFVVATRQHDSNLALKSKLGTAYEEKIESFRNYVEDLQSATDSGDMISANHFYSETKSFPIKNDNLIKLLDQVNNQIDDSNEDGSMSASERKSLSENLNKLQLTLLDIIAYAEDDSMTWYKVIQPDDDGIQTIIDKRLK